MTTMDVESYLRRLDRELRKRFVADASVLEEARAHLADAIERGQARGQSLDAAREEAISRFGAPEIVAAAVAADRSRVLYRALLVAGALGLMGPRKPWAWALGVGIWIPAWAMVDTPSWHALPMLLVLAFPFTGAYVGMAVRRMATPAP